MAGRRAVRVGWFGGGGGQFKGGKGGFAGYTNPEDYLQSYSNAGRGSGSGGDGHWQAAFLLEEEEDDELNQMDDASESETSYVWYKAKSDGCIQQSAMVANQTLPSIARRVAGRSVGASIIGGGVQAVVLLS